MRILIAVHGYPPTHASGAEREAERAARRLASRGHDVIVVATESVTAPHSDLRISRSIENGVDVRRLYLNLDSGGDAFRWSYDNPQIEHAVSSVIDERRPDVLHLFSGYLMSGSCVRAARAAKVPVVVSLMDYWWLCHRITLVRSDGRRCSGPTPAGCARCHAEQFRRYRLPARALPVVADAFWAHVPDTGIVAKALHVEEQLERSSRLLNILGDADAIIAPSAFLASRYEDAGVNGGALRIWRQGVDIDRCLIRPPSNALRVGYLGQVKPHKGVHLLVDAWSRLTGPRERSLQLYGSDNGEEAYGQTIRQRLAGLHDASWNGSFAGNEVWEILANLDVVVVPSRWVENSPNSILEAQAMGVPVVGTNLGGTAELVKHEWNGLLFEVDNSADLARQLQRLLDEPDLLTRLRNAWIPFRTVDDDVERVEILYASLLNPRPTEHAHDDSALPVSSIEEHATGGMGWMGACPTGTTKGSSAQFD